LIWIDSDLYNFDACSIFFGVLLFECDRSFFAGFRDDELPFGITLSDLGYGIEVEVWEIEIAAFGEFVVEVPAPLGIGATVLENGEMVKGFICENWGIANALDISDYGGWRAYRDSLKHE
jgi:hypothetical protein